MYNTYLYVLKRSGSKRYVIEWRFPTPRTDYTPAGIKFCQRSMFDVFHMKIRLRSLPSFSPISVSQVLTHYALVLSLLITYNIYNSSFSISITFNVLGGNSQLDIIKVAGTSRTSAVAGAIAGIFRENKRAIVQAIGAIAVNQAVKALALSRAYLQEDGYDVVFITEFVDIEIEDKIRTAMRFTVEPR